MESPNPELETRLSLQRQLSDLEGFMATKIYANLQFTQRTSLSEVQQAILQTCPTDLKTLFENIRFYGQAEEISRSLNSFEEAREVLKERINEMIDREQQVTTTKSNEII